MRLVLAAAASTALIAFSAPVRADGVPEPYTAPVMLQVSNWSGFYVGLNAGWQETNTDWQFQPGLPGQPNQTFTLNNDSFVLGGHIGAQVQWGNIVLGVEGAVSQPNIGNDGWTKHFGYGVNFNNDAQTRVSTLYTVGPRIGWAQNQWLVFGGGGFATAHVETRGSNLTTGAIFGNTNNRQDGWYAGGGLEYMLASNVIIGLEYQHVSLDDELHRPIDINPITNQHVIGVDEDIVRARISYGLGRERVVGPLK
jgi:outer membrane immunogenic protein